MGKNKKERKTYYLVVYVCAENENPYHEYGNDSKPYETYEEAFECAKLYLVDICEYDGTDLSEKVEELRTEGTFLSARGNVKVEINQIFI